MYVLIYMNLLLLKMLNTNQEEDKNNEKHFTFGPHQSSYLNELSKISSFKRYFLRFLYKEYEDSMVP